MAYSCKKGKIIHDVETPVNELQRKQRRRENFELVIFGETITKVTNPSLKARWDKLLALKYSVVGTKVRGV